MIIGGNYLRISLRLESTSDSDVYDGIRAYMLEYIDFMLDDFSKSDFGLDGLEVTFFSSRSFGDEAASVLLADAGVYAATFIVMIVYLAFNLGSFSCVGARAWLAGVTMLCMIMALLIGYGLSCGFGLVLNTVCFLLPYILIGVGVDDEILIIEAVDRTPYPSNEDPYGIGGAKRFEKALKHCGLSISLTSFCSVMAFLVGTNVTMPGVQAFCAVAAFSFSANYILQFLIFLPLFALDEKRKLSKRNFCCCCIKHEDYQDEKEEKLEAGAVDTDTDDKSEEKKKFSVECLREYTSVLGLVTKIVIPSLSKRIYRFGIAFGFIIIFVLSLVGLQFLKVESDSSRLVPDTSYVIDYLDLSDDAFESSSIVVVDIVLNDLDFSEKEIRDAIFSMITDIETFDKEYKDNGDTETAFIIGNIDEWLTDFVQFINDTNYNESGITIDDLDSTEFYQQLKVFANTTQYVEWANEIIYDDYDNPTKISATRFYADFSLPQVLSDQWPVRNDLQDIIESYVGENNGYGFRSNWPFAFFEFSIVELTVRNIGSGSAGVLFILMIMMDIKMAWFIIIVVLMIDIELFGWMVMVGVSLDSITFIQLVMAVGLTVDYVIHIMLSLIYLFFLLNFFFYFVILLHIYVTLGMLLLMQFQMQVNLIKIM